MDILLPPGTWYDRLNWRRLTGGARTVNLEESSIPVFIREGAIIPRDRDPLTPETEAELLIIPGPSRPLTWYRDDGVTRIADPAEAPLLEVERNGNHLTLDGHRLSSESLRLILPAALWQEGAGFLREGDHLVQVMTIGEGVTVLRLPEPRR